jgi:protein-S-isoprenylcysteine O-methyltransferase Ste14
MRRKSAVLGSVLFFVLAPGTVAGLLPWWISGWQLGNPAIGWFPIRIAGVLMAAAGTLTLLDSFVRFAMKGLGTPSPIFPTRHLVVSGLYRYVRNPMYLAVVAVILGQGMIFANTRLLEYGVLVWLGFHLFVVAYEEPTLWASFGQEYASFCNNVARWIPLRRPTRPPQGKALPH